MQVFFSILSFMYDHREDIKKLILQVEGLMGEAPGTSKMAVVRGWIGTAMGIEQQIESAWPMVAPFFNLMVSLVKGKVASA